MPIVPRSLLRVLLVATLVPVLAPELPAQERPPTPSACVPYDVLPDELTPVYIYGEGFVPETRISIEGVGDLLYPVLLGPDLIAGYTPPLDPENANQPPGWKTIVAYTGPDLGFLDNAVLYVEYGAPYLKHCFPSEIAPEGGTYLRFHGRNFHEGLVPSFHGVPCEDPVLVSESEMTAYSPPLAPLPEGTYYGGEMRDGPGGPIVTSRDGMLAVIEGTAPPAIASVEPAEVDARGGTAVAVHGERFRPTTVFVVPDLAVGGLVDPQLVSPELVTAVAPPTDPLDPATPPGFRDLLAFDERGDSLLIEGLRYVDKIRDVVPWRVSAAGGDPVAFEGFGFDETFEPRVADVPLLDVERADSTLLRGRMPPLEPGVYSATLVDGDGAVVGYLPNRVEVVPFEGPAILAVEPSEISSEGGATVTFVGRGFAPDMVPVLGGEQLISPTFLDSERIAGTAPDFAALSWLDAVLLDAHGDGVASLPRAVFVAAPPPVDAAAALGPVDGLGSLAEGRARFEWANPVPVSSIRVLDAGGALQTILPGDSTLFEVPVAAHLDERPVYLQSVFPDGQVSDVIEILARRSACDAPPPLTGIDRKGDIELVLMGGDFAGEPERCVAPTEITPLPDLAFLGLSQIREYSPFRAATTGAGASLEALAGAIISHHKLQRLETLAVADPGLRYVRRLARHQFTGFRLVRDATALQIDAFYSMPVFAFDLKLKGRLIHAFPADGFEDVFTFPTIQATSRKTRVGVTYYRASHDVLDPAARSCGLPIPAGDYVLELFAEGGDPDTAHFIFESDGRNEEIVIPGVPCPPYPRVQVTDLTGKRSLPVITKITGRQVAAEALTAAPVVQFTAHGYWVDEDGVERSLNPADAAASGRPFRRHDFNFAWKVHDQEPPTVGESRGDNRLVRTVKRIGCYEVDVEVRDADCPRSVSRTYEVVVFPTSFQCNSPYYSVLNPVPDPATIKAVVGFGSIAPGFNVPPGRRESFRVFVVPQACCAGDIECPAVDVADLEFILTSGGRTVYTVPGRDVEDLCQRLQKGPKYLKVTVDVDRIALLPGGDGGRYAEVWLEARAKQYRDPAGGGAPSPVVDTFRRVGGAMLMTNRPPVLATTYSTASYSRLDDTYQVFLQSSREAVQRFGEIPSSAEVNLFPGIAGAVIPSFPSDVNAAMNTGFEIVGGQPWKPALAATSMAGGVLGNHLDGLPSTAPGSVAEAGERLRWEWSQRKSILSQHFQQQLFSSIIFTGFIGPVPVTVWGSVSLALGIDVVAEMSTKVAPFAPISDGGAYFESELKFLSSLKVSLPAELRTDILFGIASLTLSAIVETTAGFDVILRAVNDRLQNYLRLYANLDIKLAAKLCLFWFLCPPTIEIPLVRKTIIDYTKELGAGAGAGAAPPPPSPPGRGAAMTLSLKELLSVPASAASPDGERVLNLYYNAGRDQLTAELASLAPDGSVASVPLSIGAPELLAQGPFDVAAAFIRNDRALIVATATYPTESAVPFPLPAGAMPPPEDVNELKAQDEIVLCRFGDGLPGVFDIDTRVVRLADPPSEVAPADRRADGRPAIAGSGAFEDAIVVWVRIRDREYLVREATTTTIYEATAGPSGIVFTPEHPQTVRPKLETSAIFTRRVGFEGPLDPPRRISLEGINVQPAVAFSPSGATAWCVWVHDPEHLDLVGSNRGRNLVASVWTRATDSWSEPQPVLALPDDHPGVLEPSIALKGEDRGLLVFNALPRNAAESDTGLNGTNRFVYLSRLEGGVFGEPVLVHGVCASRVVARYTTVHPPAPRQRIPGRLDPEIFFEGPDWVLVGQQTGLLGHPESSGNILVAAIQEEGLSSVTVVPVLADDRTHTNVVGSVWNGGINTLNLKGGTATRSVAQGAGAAEPEDLGYETIGLPFEPDLAIVSCKLSDQFPGPGARVVAEVEVENRGFAGSATDSVGRSLVSLRFVYLRAGGSETIEAEEPLSVLMPWRRARVEVLLEMPLDPVRLRVELVPNPGDRDPSNDAQVCLLGAPAPEEFACEAFAVDREGDAKDELSVALRWRNPAGFDEILLWRDGQRLASLPGTSTEFSDHGASPGAHTYEIRGRIGASRSSRVSLPCRVVSEGGATFRRGDADGSGQVNITDAIVVLGYLFLGSEEPGCLASADADDNDSLQITDAIGILGFLFLGAEEPAAPGPFDCGEDPTPGAIACPGQPSCP